MSPQYNIPQELPPSGMDSYQADNMQGFPDMIDPRQGATYASQDTGFLQWLFNFRKEAIIPLRYSWRGYEFDFQKQEWFKGKSALRIMNEEGIMWGISLIESYCNPSFIVTDLDMKTYNFRMREVVRVIWNSLSLRYKEFELNKSDIHRVAEEIESKVSAILRGALHNGYRDFFSTTTQSIESRNLNQLQPQKKEGLFSGFARALKGADQKQW